MSCDPQQADLFGDPPAPPPRAQPVRHTWFFALRPAPADALRIEQATTALLRAHAIGGKRVAADRLHVTLELVGHDAADALVKAARAAAATLRTPPVEAVFDTALSFTGPSGPFVLTGSAGLDGVRHLRDLLLATMLRHGFTPPRAYQPHMTLGYDPRHRAPPTPFGPIGFRATEIALVKSHIGFSRHEVLQTWPLA